MKRNTFKFRHIITTVLLLWLTAAAALTGAQTVQAHPEGPVHTIYWKVKLRRDVKKKKKRILKKGSYAVVVKRNYNYRGSSQVRYKNGTVSVPNSALSYLHDMTTIVKEGDYRADVKEDFVNRKGITSKTQWMCWVSLDKQRVNVFKGSRYKWELVKVFPCSSGKAQTPTRAGTMKVDFKNRNLRGLAWYTDIAGGGFHDWPGALNKRLLGKHTASKGCVRLRYNDAKWIYQHIPRRSRVYVY